MSRCVLMYLKSIADDAVTRQLQRHSTCKRSSSTSGCRFILLSGCIFLYATMNWANFREGQHNRRKRQHPNVTNDPMPVFHPCPVQPILQPIAQIILDSSFLFHRRTQNMIERPLYDPLREEIYHHWWNVHMKLQVDMKARWQVKVLLNELKEKQAKLQN